jgi:hypothetical protein
MRTTDRRIKAQIVKNIWVINFQSVKELLSDKRGNSAEGIIFFNTADTIVIYFKLYANSDDLSAF